jgi:hypothetical protein
MKNKIGVMKNKRGFIRSNKEFAEHVAYLHVTFNITRYSIAQHSTIRVRSMVCPSCYFLRAYPPCYLSPSLLSPLIPSPFHIYPAIVFPVPSRPLPCL